MSLQSSNDEDECETLSELRVALLDCYLSILHGMHPDEHFKHSQPQDSKNLAHVEPYALQMFQYVEAMVDCNHLNFTPDLLRQVFEFYVDLVQIYMPKNEAVLSRASEQQRQNLDIYILASPLGPKMKSAVSALDQ